MLIAYTYNQLSPSDAATSEELIVRPRAMAMRPPHASTTTPNASASATRLAKDEAGPSQ